MTIDAVAVDDPVQASTMNQLILGANGSPGRAVIVANGTWSVPDGVHKFKVTVGSGGHGGASDTYGGSGEDSYLIPGAPGANGKIGSSCVAGVEPGTSYSITIGAGGGADTAGGTTSFGTLMSASSSAVSFAAGSTSNAYHPPMLCNSGGTLYSGGGAGSGGTGAQGFVMIEW